MITLVTSDALKAVAEFYRDHFTRNGLTVKSDFLLDHGAMISAEGTGNKFSVAVSREGQESTAVVSFSST